MPAGPHKALSAVIPAAGFSSRMKAFKPLLPLGEKTIIEGVIDLFKAHQISDIVVVTGHHREVLEPVIKRAGARPVFNPDFQSGMLSSIQKGVGATRPENAGFFLLPVDIPALRPATIGTLIQHFDSAPDLILIPWFNGVAGHPPLIPARLKLEILSLSGDSTLRDLLLSQGDRTRPVRVYDRGALMDADDPEGYEKVLQKFSSLHIPDREECLALIKDLLPDCDGIRAHLADVSSIALKLAHALSGKVDPNLVMAAGLLHDIKRKEKDHAKAGAKLLEDLGFSEVSKIVAEHMDIDIDPGSPVREKEVVYFADKICNGRGVDLNYRKRFEGSLKKSPWASAGITKRYENTQLIQARIEASAGKSIQDILSE